MNLSERELDWIESLDYLWAVSEGEDTLERPPWKREIELAWELYKIAKAEREKQERESERAREIIKADTVCVFIDGEKGLNVDSLYGAFSAGMSWRSQSSAGVCMEVGALASSYLPRKSCIGTVDLIKDSSSFFFKLWIWSKIFGIIGGSTTGVGKKPVTSENKFAHQF
jgi:hypothetical protein